MGGAERQFGAVVEDAVVFAVKVDAVKILGAFKGAVGLPVIRGQVSVLLARQAGLAQEVGHQEGAQGVEAARFQSKHTAIEMPAGLKIYIAGSGEISFIRIVGTLAEVDLVYQFGNEKMQIGVTLTMRMGNHIDGHAVDADIDIGAVVDVETTHKDLLGLAAAGMLGDEQARREAEKVLGGLYRPEVDVDLADGIQRVDRRCGNDDLVEIEGSGMKRNFKEHFRVFDLDLLSFIAQHGHGDKRDGGIRSEGEKPHFVGFRTVAAALDHDNGPRYWRLRLGICHPPFDEVVGPSCCPKQQKREEEKKMLLHGFSGFLKSLLLASAFLLNAGRPRATQTSRLNRY